MTLRQTRIVLTLSTLAALSVVGFGCAKPTPQPVACTTEAKLCPDGTAVGRTGPNCEFAACPTPPPTGKEDLIQVTAPLLHAIVTSPLHITGQARGTWFFEASFPVHLLDGNGVTLGTAIAKAQSDWMTENFVPFIVDITFTSPTTATGTLVLKKDNPSGLPEHEDELRIPVNFLPSTTSVKLYLYSSDADRDNAGNVLCSAKGLYAVDRTIAKTTTPIQDTIKKLLTELSLESVALKGASLKNGTLTLEFTDPQFKTSGGACRVSVLWAQIEATAKQFAEVQTVTFIPKTLFQP